jgi:uncharacterized protein (TIGR00730 family)
MLSVCVYCGSRMGDSPSFAAAARELGFAIAGRGGRLVYGGGRVGLMGVVADAALSAGAPVLGVIPEALMKREVGHTGLTRLLVVQTMHDRKLAMAREADAFVAMPGGIGTMEEIFEVWSWQQLGYHDKPVGLLNVDGYYDPLLAFMDAGLARGFVSPAQHAALMVETDVSRLLERLAAAATQATQPDDYSRI